MLVVLTEPRTFCLIHSLGEQNPAGAVPDAAPVRTRPARVPVPQLHHTGPPTDRTHHRSEPVHPSTSVGRERRNVTGHTYGPDSTHRTLMLQETYSAMMQFVRCQVRPRPRICRPESPQLRH